MNHPPIWLTAALFLATPLVPMGQAEENVWLTCADVPIPGGIAGDLVGGGQEEPGDEPEESGGADQTAGCFAAEGKSCGRHWWQSWKVKGEYAEGEGTVQFAVVCGTSDLVECKVGSAGIGCDTDLREPIDEPFRCVYRILGGQPSTISGKCVDPVNPAIVFNAVEDVLSSLP